MLQARHETIDRLEIFDDQGVPVGSVNKPSDPRLFGSEMGTVYLDRPPPHLPESVIPAQAA